MPQQSPTLDEFNRSVPSIGFEHVDVVFPATANLDLNIPTILRPVDPEDILYKIVDVEFFTAPAAAPVVYRDSTSTRRPWTAGHIILRSNVASLKCTLELTLRRTY